MASTNKLYPPIINGVLPAFYRATHKAGDDVSWSIKITIPFAMNQMVSVNVVKSMFLRLKTVQTNEVKYCGLSNNIDMEQGVVYFTLDSEESSELVEGLFYKAQIAYCDIPLSQQPDVTQAGYFSTVGIIKCIAKPSVAIANFDEKSINYYNNRYLGVYTQNIDYGDSNEKVYSYCFNITDKDNNIYLTSGVQLHNSNNDINHWESQDEFYVNKLLEPGVIYYLQYSVTTVNGLQLSSPMYRLMAGDSVDMEKHIDVIPELNYDEGYIQIKLHGPKKYVLDEQQHLLIQRQEDYCAGLFLLSRGHFKDDYMVWEDIARFSLNNELPSNHIEYDFTIEQGVTYKYRLQQYNLHGVYSNPVYSKEIYADFEDMFLYDGVRQLKVRFNPKVASFKVDIPEQKLETIGSKYPFIFRNGNVYYHEFPISGLISYQLDEAKLFLTKDETMDALVFENDMAYKYYTSTATTGSGSGHEGHAASNAATQTLQSRITEVQQSLNHDPKSSIRIDKDLTSENLMSERYFKLAVLAWLTNGEIKLFRSPGEGNYLVRLLNTSMTPNDTLGRMLHTFTTTAYEIDDLNYNNLLKYNLINVAAPDLGLVHFSTKEFVSSDTVEVLYTNNGDNALLHFEVNDCMPGDQVIITFIDGTSETITIGVTGSFSVTVNDKPIDKIEFIGMPNTFQYPRSITLSYIDDPSTYFDQLNNVFSTTVLGRTYCGPKVDLVNFRTEDIYSGLNYHKFNIEIGHTTPAYKTKLLNMEMLRVRARDILPLYEVEPDKYAVTPFGKGYPLAELLEMRVSDQEIVNGFALFRIYEQDLAEGDTDTTLKDKEHSLTPEESITDKQYNELYPDWKFKTYYNPLAENGVKFFTTEPDMRFAINKELNSDELSYVDITQLREVTFYNLGPIDMLWLGDGVQAETVMRIQVIDYTIEDTDATVASKKAAYLNAKNQMFEDYETFMNEHANDVQEYNQYLIDKAKVEQAIQDLAVLQQSYAVLEALTTDISVFKEDLKTAVRNAIAAVNDYKDNFYDYMLEIKRTNIIPQQANGANFPERPADIEIDDYDTRIDDAVQSEPENEEELLNDVIASIITTLQSELNTIANIYLDWLNVYYSNIPSTSNIDELLPAGWTIEQWQEATIADIVNETAGNVLELLSRMYDLLHYSNITTKPFVEGYFSDASHIDRPWLTEQWTEEMAEEVLTEQARVGGIENVSYEDIFITDPEFDEPVSPYHITSLILTKQQEYESAATALERLRNDLITANRVAEEAEALQAEAYEIARNYLDIMQACEEDNQKQQNTITTSQQLIAGLELEEPTEANQAAIRYLQSAIRAAENAIVHNNNDYAEAEAKMQRYLSGEDDGAAYDYPAILADASAKRAAANAAAQAYNNGLNNAQQLSSTVNELITEWNNKLIQLDTYLKVLKTIDVLKPLINNAAIDQEALIHQIETYLNTYNQLVQTHTSYYNNAVNMINEINSLSLAFDKLISLLEEWTARLEELEEIANTPLTPVDTPVVFDWESRIETIKALWADFIITLTDAYRIIEARYPQ